MKFLKVTIVKYVSYDQPGFVLCTFSDVYGKVWEITEKVPVLTAGEILEENLPITGFYIAGEIVSTENDKVCFNTEKPWHIATDEGETNFFVLPEQVSDTSSDDI